MKILAIDSSGMPATAAVLDDGCLAAEFTVHYQRTHSQTLLPMIDAISRMIDLDPASLDAVAVAGGPGSFTGLRIGSATAKGIGLALDRPLVHVPTLEAMACNFFGSSRILCPMMDARRSQVFAGIYSFRKETLDILTDQRPVRIEDLVKELNALAAETGRSLILLGDGADVYRSYLEENLTAGYLFAPPNLNAQRASSVAVRAFQLIREGKIQTAEQHCPDYLRVSQAERVRAEKEPSLKPGSAAE